jgi:hypothetical protein
MEFILTGDLKCNFLETNNNKPSYIKIDIMDIFQLQHVKSPTRITGGASVTKWLAHLPFTSKVAGSNLSENFSM